jgi:hypothetical protein
MTEAPTLVRVRFTTTRAALCGVHVSGFEYDVAKDFAEQVVQRERCAEYVHQEAAPAFELGVSGRRKKR